MTFNSRPGHSFVSGTPAEAHVLARQTPQAFLSRDEIQRKAPSVFATAPRSDVSARYAFIPTAHVLDLLEDRGFGVVKADQSIARAEGGHMFARHVLRFRNVNGTQMRNVGDEIPEIVLMNSHDRTSTYSLMMGIFRLVCSNGAIVMSSDFGSINVKHLGGHDFDQEVIDASYQVIEQAPRVLEAIDTWKGVELSQPQRLAFAEAALELRENKIVTPEKLLTPRRDADKKTDLWTTGQVIQENLTKGGLSGKNVRGRRAKTRPIKSVGEDIRTNKALWLLNERMAELAGAK